MYYECHKKSDSQQIIYTCSKKAAINPIHENDDNCFQYVIITLTFNHKKIWKHSKKTLKAKPFIVKYYLEGTNYSSENDDWKKLEKNSLTITLNVLYAKKEKMYSAYVSKQTQSVENKLFF